MVDQWPAMEPSMLRNPAPGDRAPPPPPPPPFPHLSDIFPADQRTSAALVLSGFFLAAIGVAFTALGWQRYRSGAIFEWTQLLGPVLLSVGGTFILSSVCKMASSGCFSCGRSDEEEEEEEAAPDLSSRGRPCAVSCINQPIVVHGSAAMLCIPPAYAYLPRDLGPVSAALPTYQAAATPQEERGSESRPGRGGGDDSASRPPAYEDLYPSSSKHTLH